MIIEHIHLEEGVEESINEALGVVDKVRDEALRFLDYFVRHIEEFKPNENEKYSVNTQILKIRFDVGYVVPIRVKVFYFRNEQDRKAYRYEFPVTNPYYSKDKRQVDMDLDVVNGKFDADAFLYYIQHEIHHAYQYYLKNKNGVAIRKNALNYEKAVGFLNLPDSEERGAGAVVYLWGTHEMSAYENGLYAMLLQNYKTKQEPVTNVIHRTQFYKMYCDVLNLYKSLNSGGGLPGLFAMSFDLSKSDLLRMCSKVIKKSQDVMAKAVAKAKFDYDEWVKEQRMTNSNSYGNNVLKPLKKPFIDFGNQRN